MASMELRAAGMGVLAGLMLAAPAQATAQAAPADAAAPADTGIIAPGDPAALVQTLYELYGMDEEAESGWRASPGLAAGMQRVLEAGDPDGVFGADPLLDAQDFRLSDISTALIDTPAPDLARVEAQFANFDQPRRVVVTLRRVDGEWQVDDITHPDWSLRARLGLPPSAADLPPLPPPLPTTPSAPPNEAAPIALTPST